MENAKGVAKIVNGTRVIVRNFELFDKAAEGLISPNNVKSLTKNSINNENDYNTVRVIVKIYEEVYKKIPYPLYAIETDIKYCAIYNMITPIIIEALKEYGIEKVPKCWVEDGLNYFLSENLILRIKGTYWGIENKNENANIDRAIGELTIAQEASTRMKTYESDIAYNDYKWIISKFKKKESLSSYYSEIMPDFMAACGGVARVLKWEMYNMLNIQHIPNKLVVEKGQIIDLDSDAKYIINIAWNGVLKEDTSYSVLKYNAKSNSFSAGNDKKKEYKVSITKEINGEIKKINQQEYLRFANIILLLEDMANNCDSPESIEVFGISSQVVTAYSINNCVYTCKGNSELSPMLTTGELELINIENDLVHTKFKQVLDSGVIKYLYTKYDVLKERVMRTKIEYVEPNKE